MNSTGPGAPATVSTEQNPFTAWLKVHPGQAAVTGVVLVLIILGAALLTLRRRSR